MSWVVHTGDCLEILRGLDRSAIDAVITDPPYGMALDTDSTRFSKSQHAVNGALPGRGKDDWPEIVGDDRPFDPAPWLEFPRVVLWGCNHFGQRLPVGTTLVWLKREPQNFGQFLSDAELAWMKGGHGVYAHLDLFATPTRKLEANLGGATAHPCQKPIGLMRWCMEVAKVPAGGTVFDPYAGSGTVGVACMLTGRHYIGCEIQPQYADIARRRIAAADPIGRQTSLLEAL